MSVALIKGVTDQTKDAQRPSVLVDSQGRIIVTDGGPSWTAIRGTAGAPGEAVRSADMSTAADLTAAPNAGQKLVVTDILFSTDTAMQFDFQEETTGKVLLRIFAAANSAYQFTLRSKLKTITADKKLQGKASVAGNVAVSVSYYSEA